jgi:uncharacterized secreted protein with C-terminal beta-propeller domain
LGNNQTNSHVIYRNNWNSRTKSDEIMSGNENKKVKGIFFIILLIITGTISSSFFLPTVESQYSYDVNVFHNYDDLFTFYRNMESQGQTGCYGHDMMVRNDGALASQVETLGGFDSPSSAEKTSSGSENYTMTNIQVEGVDEPDIVKTDSIYIYMIGITGTPYYHDKPSTSIKIYNLSDISNPKEIKTIENGFQLKGTIGHLSLEDIQKLGFYPLYEKSIIRSLFINDYLYTIFQGMVKVNDLGTLELETCIILG